MALIEDRAKGRVERIERLIEPQRVKLLPSIKDDFCDRGADAAAFIAQEGEQTDGGAAQFSRYVQKRRNVQRREDHRQSDNQHDAWPNDLPRTDLEIHLRHTIIANRQ